MVKLNRKLALLLLIAAMFAGALAFSTTYSTQAACGYHTVETTTYLGIRCGGWDFWCWANWNEPNKREEEGRRHNKKWYDANWNLCQEETWENWSKIGCCG